MPESERRRLFREYQALCRQGGGAVPLGEFAAYVARLSPGQAAALARRRALPAFKLRGRWYVRLNGYGRWLLETRKAAERQRQAAAAGTAGKERQWTER